MAASRSGADITDTSDRTDGQHRERSPSLAKTPTSASCSARRDKPHSARSRTSRRRIVTVRLEDAVFRQRLDAAIESLPPEQRTVIEMLRQGFPIDSKEPGVMTISSVLGRSEKTIRNYRDRAIAALRAALTDGDVP